MKNIKKIILLILSFAIVLSFTACSQKGETDADTDTENTQTTVQNADDTTASSDGAEGEESDSASADAFSQSETERVTSTTAAVSKSEKKGKALISSVKTALEDSEVEVNDDDISGDTDEGSFEFKSSSLDETEMYSMERSDELESLAQENAKSFVNSISGNYPYDITYESIVIESIGGETENGIDSVIYSITYTNIQNQLLLIKVDSTGTIYYVKCLFTW